MKAKTERSGVNGDLSEVYARLLWSRFSADQELIRLRYKADAHDLIYSFHMCLYASKLKAEAKKAEFATRLKMGEANKANEVYTVYQEMAFQSFETRAQDLFEDLTEPVMQKARELIRRQWIDSKRAEEELKKVEEIQTQLRELIFSMIEDPDEDVILSFNSDRQILFLPATAETDQRLFISEREAH